MPKIFIVEDETLLRELLLDYLRHLPNVEIVGTCGDGQKAIKQCIEADPDLVILDIIIPGLNGIEVLERLKAHNPQLKVLLFSAIHNFQTVKIANEAEVDGYVGKVDGIDEFRNAVTCILAGGRFFSSSLKYIIDDIHDGPDSQDSGDNLTARDQEILASIKTSSGNSPGSEG